MTLYFKFILFLTLFSCLAHGEVIESVTAIVNGGIVTKTDLVKYKDRLKTGSIVDDLLGSNNTELMNDPKALLKHIIDEKVIDDEVKKQNLNITIERVEQEINSIQKRNNITRDQLIEALKKEG